MLSSCFLLHLLPVYGRKVKTQQFPFKLFPLILQRISILYLSLSWFLTIYILQLCVWSMDGWEKKASKFLQIPSGRAINPLAQTRVQFHQDQTHLLVVHETQIAIYEASKLECVKQVCKTYLVYLVLCSWWVTIMLCPVFIWQALYYCMVGDGTLIFHINRPQITQTRSYC